ncbi:MAG: hypothetical protein CBB68_14945 [Rhodospirillaceae bacterium TMED8]|nr:MarR family transcriptional regulator [Magnetovibrio sp.]OUT47863.1 MAG: hypothetical protein CBB68_14945 [Rhodospirillaceae bacterium TMED8]
MDTNRGTDPSCCGSELQFDKGDVHDDLRRVIELLFFAYRDFTGEADVILAKYGFGRAHHRAIYFIGQNPGIAVNELLAILDITKQSLGRVLTKLLKEGYVLQQRDPSDGRKRLLKLSAAGLGLESVLTKRQGLRMQNAFKVAGPDSEARFKQVLKSMVDDPRALILRGAVIDDE